VVRDGTADADGDRAFAAVDGSPARCRRHGGAEVQTQADAAGKIDSVVSIDSTIARVHQHGATVSRDTGGSAESQESVVRAA